MHGFAFVAESRGIRIRLENNGNPKPAPTSVDQGLPIVLAAVESDDNDAQAFNRRAGFGPRGGMMNPDRSPCGRMGSAQAEPIAAHDDDGGDRRGRLVRDVPKASRAPRADPVAPLFPSS